MKNRNYKTIILLFLSLATLSFTACNETDDTTQWQKENQEAYDAIKANPEWTLLATNDGPDGVYYRDLTEPGTETGSEYPLQTASVTINYTGKYYTGQAFDSGKQSTFPVNGVVRGFGAALQKMRTGQKWEVCIPYYLGYGTISTTSMQAYTTLFFEIELLKINQYPK
ncbi:MAG: FKBP-type peptidyl-prolyl cis-trans isomerase [Dysgonamonadaceae bacterium]|jgi:FKBP-type peptidyl-prolyl cis-trans isomerase|nr:FKBP-type peptidyl-prolyl cis-trans isomerase [Dysgonamonadaceae bacterium]